MNKAKFDEVYEQLFYELDMKQTYFSLDELTFMKYHKHRFQTILETIAKFEHAARILDVGTTPFTILLKRCYPHCEVQTTDIDLNDSLAQRCNDNSIPFKKCDLTRGKLPFEDEYFDIIILAEIIEHLPIHPTKVLRDICRITRNGGFLVFSTANHASLAKRVKLLIGINPQMNIDELFPQDCMQRGYGHIREYTMGECTKLLKSNGFLIKKAAFASYWNKLDVHLIESLSFRKKFIKFALLAIFVCYDTVCNLIPSLRSGIYIVGKKY